MGASTAQGLLGHSPNEFFLVLLLSKQKKNNKKKEFIRIALRIIVSNIYKELNSCYYIIDVNTRICYNLKVLKRKGDLIWQRK